MSATELAVRVVIKADGSGLVGQARLSTDAVNELRAAATGAGSDARQLGADAQAAAAGAATLGKEASQAGAALNVTGRSAESANAAVLSLTTVEAKLEAILQATIAATKTSAVANDQLSGKLTETATATKIAETATVALGVAEAGAEAQTGQLAHELEQVSAAARIAASAQDAAAVAIGKSTNAQLEGVKAANDASTAANEQASAMANAGQQIVNLGVSASDTGGVTSGLGEKAGELGSALSEMGGTAGKVGAFFEGPWGVALNIAVEFITPFVEALFEGADGSDNLVDRQAALAGQLDRTTGKMREQVSALTALFTAQDSLEELGKNRVAYKSARDEFNTNLGQEANRTYIVNRQGQVPFLPETVSSSGKALLRQLSALAMAGVPAVDILKKLNAAAAIDPTLNNAATAMSHLGREVAKTSTEGGKNLLFLARLAVSSGNATAFQKRLVAANTDGVKVDLGLADARAKLGAATTVVEKAQAALDVTRRQGRAAVAAGTKSEAQYEAEVLAGEKAVNSAQQAVKAAAEGKRLFVNVTRDAAKETRDDAKAVREAERANQALELSYDRLSRRLNPFLGHLRDYAATLANIAELQNAGKITFGDAVTLNLAASNDKQAADEKVASEKAQAVFGEDGGLRDVLDGADRLKDAAYEAAQALGGDLAGAADALADGLGSIFGSKFGSGVRGLLGKVTGESGQQDEKLRASISSLAKGIGISDEAATKIGKFGGKAIEGAATGALTQSFLAPIGKALGVKTSQTGAQVGGAIGQLGSNIPGIGPFLPVIGSIAGSLIGGAFKKTKSGAVTLTSATEAGTVTGNSGAAKKAAGGLADSVQASLNAIAEQLGGDVGKFNVTVGQRHGDYRVTTGTSLKVKNGAQDFNDDVAAAQAAAVRIAITQGAVVGLSGAMQKAIQSNTDIDKALSEALKVKDLEELIGGVGSALQATFKSVETTAAERMRVAKAYGLDLVKVEAANAKLRADTFDQVMKNSIGSIQSLLDDLSFGDLSEGSPAEQRGKILDQIAKAKADAEAGVEGSIETLTGLQRRLLEVSKAGFGTAGPEYAADRSGTTETLERLRTIETDRVKAAQDEARKLTTAVDKGNTLASEGNDALAEIATHTSALRDTMASLSGTGGVAAVFDTTRRTKL